MRDTQSGTSELLTLMDNLQYERGTLEQAEAWLARLREINPHFDNSDAMLSLEDLVNERRLTEQLRAEYGGGPLSREQLVALAESLDYSQAESLHDIHVMDARRRLFRESVPHPRADDLLDKLGDGMAAEEIVDAALTFTAIPLPGNIDPDWNRT